jgi:hypothetical protein
MTELDWRAKVHLVWEAAAEARQSGWTPAARRAPSPAERSRLAEEGRPRFSVGWRFETTDPTALMGGPLLDALSGSPDTVGPHMGSFPAGGWSQPAACWSFPDGHPGREKAPVAWCSCGYRVCADIETVYNFARGALSRNSPQGWVLVRVETRGKAVANETGRNLDTSNCLSARQIRPIWPAYVVNPDLATMLREHYRRDDIYLVDSFKSGLGLWADMKSDYE